MKVLGVLSRKGGAGKTTLATNLAVLAQEAGRRVLLVDLDPQRSAASWWRSRDAETPQLVETDPGQLREILDGAREADIELVVIDTRPSGEADVALVAALSDLSLIPTRPAVFDLRAILGTLDQVQAASRRALIVLNACPAPRGAGEASAVVDARRALAAFGVPVAPTSIVQRSAFPTAALAGLAVTELDFGGKAAAEMRALWRAVEKEMNDGKAQPGKRPGKKAGGAGRTADGAVAGGAS